MTVRANIASKVARGDVKRRRGGALEPFDDCFETGPPAPLPRPGPADGRPCHLRVSFFNQISIPHRGVMTFFDLRHSQSLVSVLLSTKKTRSVENRST